MGLGYSPYTKKGRYSYIYKERKIFIYTNRGRYSKHKNRGRRDRIQDGFNLELIELWRET